MAVSELLTLSLSLEEAGSSELRSRQAGDGVGVALYGEGGRHQSGNALFRAVVLLRGALGGHGDLVLGVAVGDRQGAFGLGDDVVAGLGVAVERVAERVGAAAHQRLAAGVAVVRALAVHKAVARNFGTQWLVKEGKLNLILNQRSQDMLTANGWNVMQYAALQYMFAQVSGLEVGTLTHNIGDCHIYDRHIPLVEKLIEAKPMDVCPKLIINNSTKDFYEFKVEDFEVQGYDYNKEVKIGKIPVAE